MEKPIFYTAKVTNWDKISIAIYFVLTAFLWYSYKYTTDNEIRFLILSGYSTGTQLLLYIFNYKSLRNLIVYFVWIFISLFHLFLYFYLIDDNSLIQKSGYHAADGLRNTILLLLVYQVLRYISARTQGGELVCSSRSGSDLWDNRKITIVDTLLFIIYMGAFVLFQFVI